MEYAGFEAECNNSIASPVNNGCEGLETLQNTFRINYFTKPAFPITYNSDGCDVSSWGFYRNPAVDYKTIFNNGVVAAPGGAFHFDYGHAMCVTDEFTINYRIMPLSQPPLGQIYIPISLRAGTVFTIFYLWMNNGSGAIQDGATGNYTTVPGLSYTPHLNSWVNIGVKFKPSNGEVWVYVNGVQVLNKITSFTGVNTINAVNSLSLQTFVGMEMKLDRVKIDNNTNGDVLFNEEFNGACSNFAIINPAYDCAKAPCPIAFQTYYNQVKGTNLTYAQIQTVYANCAIPFNPCINIPPPPNGPRLCGIIEPPKLPELIVEGPCDYLNDMALQIATQQYNAWLTIQNDRFDETYLTRCLQARNYETFTVSAQQAEYHYTLYYYDQAGSLVKTVPPQGVQANFTPAFINLVKAHRLAGNAIAYTGAGANVPAHTLVTQYRYNSLNQVVAQISPDGGLSHFWYDELGRLAISQNARQKMTNKYSYTLYDDLGRIKEVGQKTNTTLMSQVISQDKAALYSWITSTLNREQITRTTYDAVATNLQVSYPQQNLRNRVSFTQVFDAADPGIAENFNHNNATYYTYDIHGNVDVLLQDYKALMEGNSPGNRFKIIKYRYDLISGKVNEVAYQPGMIDGYMHHYEYDAENRITQVLTSRDAEFNANTGYRGGYWERDATYKYYRHGPLARSVLGQLQVQGLDYAYTLQGWLKGVNSTAINGATDMGGDGAGSAYTGAALNSIARDAYSYSLNYFNGDYTHISTTAATPFANILTAGGGSLPALADGQQTGRALYNGNIAAMAVNMPKLGVAKIYGYNYDQLNRITAMNGYNGFNNANNSFAPSTTEEYKERINYDANGNILNYLRNGDAARMSMDNMQYSYNAGNNQLNKVVDNAQDASTSEYDKYNDIKQGQNTGNYQYDEIGNLISDVSEGITNITWNVYGKIQTITKVKNEVNTLIYYTYDAAGNRISKQVSQPDVFYSASTLIYVRDASGNVMSVYRSFTAPSNEVVLKQTEVHLYGSSRLGIVNTNVDVTNGSIAVPQASITTFARGYKNYELSNHLGNVLVTISDKKLLVIPGDDGSGCVPGTGVNILNVYSRSTTQLTYIARQEVNLLPDFESLNPDEFTAYIDPALPECIPIESVPLPPGSYYSADVITANDYYPGGMQMPGRKYAQPNSSYRYGFNGKENDNEVKGEGNQQDYGLRIYDPRLGKFLSVDPLTASYPWYSPYQFAGNNPIKFIDLDGGEPKDPGKYDGQGAIAPQIVDGNTCADTENDRWTWKNSQWNYTTFNVTNSELASVFPTGKTESLKQVETSVNLTGSTFGINSKKSLAHFLSQAGAEVGGFSKGFDIEESLNYSVDGLTGTFGSYFYNGKAVAGKLDANLYGRITVNKKVTQLANQEGIGNQAYASRMGNGDFASGDGYKYRGRGMFQLTGKFNYTAFNNFINEAGVDIVAKPELILTTAYAIKSAMWYYKTAVVDKLKIESATVEQVTKKVNGGKNGLSDRETIYDNAIENLK